MKEKGKTGVRFFTGERSGENREVRNREGKEGGGALRLKRKKRGKR